MKMKNLILSSLTIGAVLLSTGCMGKYNHGDFGNKMFTKYDDDKNGYVDKTEYFLVSQSRFERADENDDKKVSKEESKETFIGKYFPEKIAKWFKQSDLDSNNYVSYEEMRKKSKKEFFEQDTNIDSKLTKKEMRIYISTQRFNEIDKNKDGSISQQEYLNIKSPFTKKD